MNDKLYVGRPNIGSREAFLARVNDIYDRRWLSNDGPYVLEFEAAMSRLLDVRHCVAMCNATVGLEIAIRALGLTGEVILPSFTFIATAHALQWQQITPVFCDIDPLTHNIDPSKVEALITPRTTAIMGVHLWGRACNVEALQQIADRHGLKLLFDAAHAFACSDGGRMIGGFGDAEVFSFHATKFINTLEGGIVSTNNDDLALRLRRMKNFGFTGYDQVESIGTNGKMNEVSAAMGLTNLESLDEFIDINRAHYHRYRERLSDLPGLTVMSYDETGKCNFQYIVVELDSEIAGISRDELVRRLHEQGVIARRYFFPGCHRMEPYLSLYPEAGRNLPETERLVQRLFCLPTGSGVSVADLERVCDIIRGLVK
ncbi:MAG: aminotransferase class I/II-fold pyridoxal phosphate-dependent enzyme [Prosthecobacter sp.]|uniref:aminotransferase class I/II-fold pyridoxal phosphate-dependent enzyme n=1 Tax=Prosthecobacter sp. TaxID=1965333 RepID=UPI0025FFB4AB|nr:aminotransferase class I/II-fold pyridoxal phosphate-dependent enzyme [Prosthecobacter sp.]MCF7787392.1 aminotransferase class I/II-fold pyridoxal phosphate-dependent enzyme [Prosthecobacter sp.]